MGAGAYILKELVRGDHYTMAKNPGFYDAPRPYLDQITLKASPDTGTGINALLAGTAQIANMGTITPDTKRGLDAGLKSYFTPRPGALLVKFNTTRPPFDDPPRAGGIDPGHHPRRAQREGDRRVGDHGLNSTRRSPRSTVGVTSKW